MTRDFFARSGTGGRYIVFLRTGVLFYRASHAADEVTLKEKKDQNHRDYGNKDRRCELIILGGELGTELHQTEWQRSQIVRAQKDLCQDEFVPGSYPVENAQSNNGRHSQRQCDTKENSEIGTAVDPRRLNNCGRDGAEETPHHQYSESNAKSDVKDDQAG